MVPGQKNGLCRICAGIDFVEYFRRPIHSSVDQQGFVGATSGALDLGSFRAIYARSRYCVFCDLVVWSICTKRRKFLTSPEILMETKGDLGCYMFSYCYAESDPLSANSQRAYRIGIASKTENGTHFRPTSHIGDIQLLAKDATRLFEQELFYGRFIHTEKLRIEQVRGWLSHCERDHKDFCESPIPKSLTDADPQDLLAIDVKRECICYLPMGSKYVALSYCWPVGKHLLLRKANRHELFNSGSLAKKEGELSPIVQDAISFVRDFGEAYLWIDALCIVQDDKDHQRFQISQMDKVYASAVVTLVSAVMTMSPAGACEGLPSYRANGYGRRQITSTIRDLHLAVPYESIHSLLESCRWYTRGWTYQECLLSGRVLFFTVAQVYFQCSCAVYCEDAVGEGASLKARFTPTSNLWNVGRPSNTEDREFGSLRLNLQREQQGDFFRFEYARQLGEYMSRDLSFASDILNAFKGVQNVLEKAMKSKFWYGIPEIYIDYCLLWTAKRLRKQRDTPLKDTPSRLEAFPSWSWAGWNWHVELGNYFGNRGVRREVPWFLINGVGDAILLVSREMPGRLPFPRKDSKDINMFESAEENVRLKIKPRHEVDLSGPAWTEPAYLATYTQIAQFHLPGTTNWMGPHSNVWPQSENLKITNASGQWVGSILLDWLWVEDNLHTTTQSFSFLLVSRSETPFEPLFSPAIDFFDHHVCPERPWCFLNVVLIRRDSVGERDGDVAQRQGVGIIHEDAWVQAHPRASFVKLK